MTAPASDGTAARAITLYGVGSVQVTATEDAALVIVVVEAPFTAADGGDAWQPDTTVAETTNEAVAVAADAVFEASPAPIRPRANATDKHFIDSLPHRNVASQVRPFVLSA
jgi:hypothetical protein